jgi:hypothetical protein
MSFCQAGAFHLGALPAVSSRAGLKSPFFLEYFPPPLFHLFFPVSLVIRYCSARVFNPLAEFFLRGGKKGISYVYN